MKKVGKLTLRKETVTQLNNLQAVQGGGSRLIYTVYYPVYSDFCTRDCPILA